MSDTCKSRAGQTRTLSRLRVFASPTRKHFDDANREDAQSLKTTRSRKTRRVTDAKFRVSDTLVKIVKPQQSIKKPNAIKKNIITILFDISISSLSNQTESVLDICKCFLLLTLCNHSAAPSHTGNEKYLQYTVYYSWLLKFYPAIYIGK